MNGTIGHLGNITLSTQLLVLLNKLAEHALLLVVVGSLRRGQRKRMNFCCACCRWCNVRIKSERSLGFGKGESVPIAQELDHVAFPAVLPAPRPIRSEE